MASTEFLDIMFSGSLRTLIDRLDSLDAVLKRQGTDGFTSRTYESLSVLIDHVVGVDGHISIGTLLKDDDCSWLRRLS
jgi:hypothetical protein